jgi:hypothetical protein
MFLMGARYVVIALAKPADASSVPSWYSAVFPGPFSRPKALRSYSLIAGGGWMLIGAILMVVKLAQRL